MSPNWSEVVVVVPTLVPEDKDDSTIRGLYGKVFIDGRQIQAVVKLEYNPIIGAEDIAEVTMTFNPRSLRILLDSDFIEEEGVLVYNSPRKLIIRR